MSEDVFSLPLFPLHEVLFPNVPLHLHVFEERYKVMIGNCVDRGEPFGAILIQEGNEVGTPAVPHSVGCLARILAVNRLDDGRIHLLAVGEERFRLLGYRVVEVSDVANASQGYLLGTVEKLEDEVVEDPHLPLVSEEVMGLFRRYVGVMAEYARQPIPEIPTPNDPTQLSFYIGAVIQLSLDAKQKLLAMTDLRARLAVEAHLLQRQIQELEKYVTEEKSDVPQEAFELLKHHEVWRNYYRLGRN